MQFKAWMWIPFFATIAIAGGTRDFRFSVSDEHFKDNVKVVNAENTCVDGDSAHLHSVKLHFPLESGKLYLRSKIKGNQYGWFSGNIKAPCYKDLHAFNLQANHLTALEAVHMRFYATPHMKPFQDEGEIYFDRRYLYSSRVKTLYFVQNGKWQKLVPTSLTGVVVVDSLPKNTTLRIDADVYNTPITFAPVDTGLFYATFFIPDAYPVTEGVHVTTGKTASLRPRVIPLDTLAYEIQTEVTEEKIKGTKSLEETEILYDRFIDDMNASDIDRGTIAFDSIYPKVKNPPRGMDKNQSQYVAYAATFEATRSRARSLWFSKRLSKITSLNQALNARLEEQQMDTVQLELIPETISKNDSGFSILFKDSLQRTQVEWNGRFTPAVPDSALVAEAKNPAIVRFVLTVENKPVWKYDGARVKSRHHYRFLRLNVRFRNALSVGEGTFTLPAEILSEREVQEWLNPKPEVETVETAQNLAKNSVQTVKAKPSIEELSRAVAEIDSGTFRYKNRIVHMSPFGIRKTEVTIAEYRDVMKDSTTKFTFNDSLMPVHNVNWNKARNFCKALGGDLPTEAQWEFAARAGMNEGSLWRLRKGDQAFQFAIFRADGPQRVASTKPNAWDLYDVSGNVAEWTRDSYSWFSFYVEEENPTGALFGDNRVFKGGSWNSKTEDELDLTDRDDEDPRYWSNTLGFRCVFPSKFQGNSIK
ncbi:MAG: SUMF1/EgtB/PvdO family nonheme iron enzyme [Fibrobacter sp.]|nr:SUMF1/EgtB/PvdO family nonheme iron enzyme [Fibrobacter sp.]